MNIVITGVGEYDPYCCNRVCVIGLAAVPTAEEFAKMKKLTAEFFTERAQGSPLEHPPRLSVNLDGQNLIFVQLAASAKTDRDVFQKLIHEKLGFILKTPAADTQNQTTEVAPNRPKETPKRAPRHSRSTSIPINQQPAAA